MKWLIENLSIIPMTGPDHWIKKGYIVIEGDRIQAVGEGEAPLDSYETRLDGRNQMALPGFINTHTHAACLLYTSDAADE